MNAERLLGELLASGVRKKSNRRAAGNLVRRAMGNPSKGVMALGALGVAWGVAEHLMEKRKAGPAPTADVPPPPSPSRSEEPPPPPPPRSTPETTDLEREAILLIRAMIAAAQADGEIDAQERKAILGRLHAIGATDEEQKFIENELADPPKLEALIATADRPDLKEQFYTVSLLAIDPDTDSEQAYLSDLAERLGLASETVKRIEESLV